jgi:hypothetical protein
MIFYVIILSPHFLFRVGTVSVKNKRVASSVAERQLIVNNVVGPDNVWRRFFGPPATMVARSFLRFVILPRNGLRHALPALA